MRALVRGLELLILGRRLRLQGLGNIPAGGPALIVGNHAGAIDPVLLGIHLKRRDVYYMAKAELFKNPALGWLFNHCHAFPVVRDSPDRAALKTALDHLARGRLLVLYPEGTRTADGTAGAPHAGAGFIARRAGVPLVPVATWGSDAVIPRGIHLPKSADVWIRIGSPFRLPERNPGERPLSNREAADLMMQAVRSLLPGAESGSPAVAGPSPAA